MSDRTWMILILASLWTVGIALAINAAMMGYLITTSKCW